MGLFQLFNIVILFILFFSYKKYKSVLETLTINKSYPLLIICFTETETYVEYI